MTQQFFFLNIYFIILFYFRLLYCLFGFNGCKNKIIFNDIHWVGLCAKPINICPLNWLSCMKGSTEVQKIRRYSITMQIINVKLSCKNIKEVCVLNSQACILLCDDTKCEHSHDVRWERWIQGSERKERATFGGFIFFCCCFFWSNKTTHKEKALGDFALGDFATSWNSWEGCFVWNVQVNDWKDHT